MGFYRLAAAAALCVYALALAPAAHAAARMRIVSLAPSVTETLFALGAGPDVVGVSTFTKTFAARGPRDHQGRSLRDFDLQKRMFRYPLSYMIYSEAFDAMPDQVRERVYRRLYDVLTGRDQSDKFKRLSSDDRRAVLEILRETKPGLPAYFKTDTVGAVR